MKLIEDRKVCWQDQYQGWHVGVTFLRGGMEVRRGKETLVRHKHTGELEMVNSNWIKDYPMEPIPEPGQSSIVDQILERERQSMEEMADSMWLTPAEILKPGDLVQIRRGVRWADKTYMKYVGQVAAVEKPSYIKNGKHVADIAVFDNDLMNSVSITMPVAVLASQRHLPGEARHQESDRLGPRMLESGWPHTPPVDDIAKAKELVAKGKAWFDDLERHYLK
jgi:hypothetical protein